MNGSVRTIVILALTFAFISGNTNAVMANARKGFVPQDRVSLTERFLRRPGPLRANGVAHVASLLPPTKAYRTIRRIDFPIPGAPAYDPAYPNGFVTDLNNLGQITYSPTFSILGLPAYVLNEDGSHRPISESLLQPIRRFDYWGVSANALNDVGGVAGEYDESWPADGTEFGFSGNAGWQFDRFSRYSVSYVDGYDNGATAVAMNNLGIAVGMSGPLDTKHVYAASAFSATVHRRVLTPFSNELKCSTHEDAMSEATGINDSNEIVGYQVYVSYASSGSCYSQEAAIFDLTGTARRLFTPKAGSVSVAEAINSRGDIVGYAGAGQIKAFLFRQSCGCVTFIPRPIGEHEGDAEAFALNASDEVVGDLIDYRHGIFTAFLLSGGKVTDLNALLPSNSGWSITSALAINDAGEIIGYGYYTDPATQMPVLAAYAMER